MPTDAIRSSAGNDYNVDYHAELAPGGEQMPMLNVFVRRPEGIFHSWGSEMLYAPPTRARTRATST